MARESGNQEYLRGLLRQLIHNRNQSDHAIILENLHRFEECHEEIARRLGVYLCRQLCSGSRRRQGPAWRAFLTLRRMNAVRREAIAAAMVARHHPLSRFRLAARAYLEFVAEVSDC
jgi:hypothetical protein